MSQTEESRQTQCIEEGCEYGVRFLEEVEDGYRLTCGEHKGDDAIELARFDFRPLYDETHLRRKFEPEKVAALRAMGANVLNFLPIEKGSPRTVSVVVRSGEVDDPAPDHEMVYESILYHSPGIYALARLGDSTDVEDAREYLRDVPEQPEWAELRYRDPPLEHHAKGVECVDCGASAPMSTKGSAPSESTYDRVPHDADCPNATEDDLDRAREQELADEIRDRTDPDVMALSCIYAETAELRELRAEDEWGLLTDPVRERFRKIADVLEERTAPRFPDCPACDGELNADHEGVVECDECSMRDVDDDVLAEIEHEYTHERHRMWGWHGHGGRKPAEVTDGQ